MSYGLEALRGVEFEGKVKRTERRSGDLPSGVTAGIITLVCDGAIAMDSDLRMRLVLQEASVVVVEDAMLRGAVAGHIHCDEAIGRIVAVQRRGGIRRGRSEWLRYGHQAPKGIMGLRGLGFRGQACQRGDLDGSIDLPH